jgi:hypothetical protein
MEVTLQKASKLSKALAEATKALTISKSVAISIFSADLEADLQKARALFEKNVNKASAFIAASYEIRQSVSSANAKIVDGVSVDLLLTQRAEVEAKEKFISALAGKDSGSDVAFAKRQLEAALARYQKEHYGSETVNVSVLSEEALEEIKTQLFALRRKKNDLTDQLQAINSNTKIKLSPKIVDALRDAELI